MTQIVELFTFVSSAVIMAADIGIVIIIVALIGRSANISRLLLDFVSRYAIFIGFMMAAGSLAGSLFYSNYAGFAPCSLCWIQRIFIYPLVPIFTIALWKNDRNVADYALSLSVIGTLVAAYHTYIQFGGVSLVPCSATVSCVQRFFVEFGYITIPTMSLTAFMLITLCMFVMKINPRSQEVLRR